MSTKPDWIDPEIVAELLAEGRVVLLDVRPPAEYYASLARLPGAIHVDPGSGARIDEVLSRVPREKLIVVYDGDGGGASAQVARRARELGLGDASSLTGGYRAWRAADLPLEENPDAAERRP